MHMMEVTGQAWSGRPPEVEETGWGMWFRRRRDDAGLFIRILCCTITLGEWLCVCVVGW